MGKQRKAYVFMVILIISLFAACVQREELQLYEKSKVKYSGEIDMNTPEGLAHASSQIFKKMINGEILLEEAFDAFLELTPESNRKSMLKDKAKFIKNAGATKDLLEELDSPIEGFDYSKTRYQGEDEAIIMRVQKQKNGDRYYYVQTFIKENGIWRIKGDNPTNPFKLK